MEILKRYVFVVLLAFLAIGFSTLAHPYRSSTSKSSFSTSSANQFLQPLKSVFFETDVADDSIDDDLIDTLTKILFASFSILFSLLLIEKIIAQSFSNRSFQKIAIYSNPFSLLQVFRI